MNISNKIADKIKTRCNGGKGKNEQANQSESHKDKLKLTKLHVNIPINGAKDTAVQTLPYFVPSRKKTSLLLFQTNKRQIKSIRNDTYAMY